MNLIGVGLAGVAGVAGVGATAVVLAPPRWRTVISGVATVVAGVAGTVAGVAALVGDGFTAQLPALLPLAGLHLTLDSLGGLFLAVAGAVIAVAAGYGVGYTRPAATGQAWPGRTVPAVLPLLAASLMLVPAAGSVSTLLVLWELMALTSLVLVLAEHHLRAGVGRAGLWYAVMTHLGFAAILLGLVVFAAAAGGETFEALRSAELSPAASALVFGLTFAGFGSKAGLVPLHSWLPRAHPESPSHVSAMLSAAMVNLGVYGVLRVGFDLLGGGTRGWWLVVLAAGGASALYGVLQAVVASGLKRLLAYSTVENMGLVFLGVGAAGLFQASGSEALAAIALAAALLHVVNHAGFKTLLFLAAGSVLRATGLRDLDSLGGLRRRMPVTTALFAVGALGAVALPPGNGFASEWLLLQALVHPPAGGGVLLALVLPVAVGVVALTTGVAVAAFVKALGIGFFARPRTTAAAESAESPPSMLAAMGVAAAACVALAAAPAAWGPALSRTAGTALGTAVDPVQGGVTMRLAGVASTVSPLLIAAAVVVATVAVVAVVKVVGRALVRRREAALWDCGAGPPTARMQYTATSFAEPLQRVFDDVLAPEANVDVTAHAESRYVLERIRYRQQVPDRIEHRLYRPVIAAAGGLARFGRGLANGSVHRYLAYGFFGLVGLLVVLVVIP